MIIRLSWRNIWRNKRRTMISSASILFAVLFSVTADSFNRGVFDGMIDSVVRFYSGYVQIMQKGYWDDRSLDLTIDINDSLDIALKAYDEVLDVVPRLESVALASFGNLTKSSMIVGIDPEKENKLTQLESKITSGAYLKSQDQSVLIGEGLAQKLKLQVSDTIVLISQGYRGVNAAGLYEVKGIVSFGSPEMNNSIVYMPLASAQYFYGAESLASSLVLNVSDKYAAHKLLKSLKESDKYNEFEIKDWEEMMPELMEMKALKQQSGKIMDFILYLIVSFGIFGVILMMTKERQYEFAVLLSIGMSRSRLSLITFLESLLLGLIGVLMGVIISYFLMYYIYLNPIEVSGEMAETYEKFGIDPILRTSLDIDIFLRQAVIVMGITSFLALYPIYNIFKLNPVKAMRNH